MFAPDPVFYTSSDKYVTEHGLHESSTPFFITNKGLSISMPAHDTVRGRWKSHQAPSLWYGEQAPVAAICFNEIDVYMTSQSFPYDTEYATGWLRGVALFLAPSPDRSMSYSRTLGSDANGEQATMFRGHLLSIAMRISLFRHHFRPATMFVRAEYGCKSLFGWDQTPEVAVIVLKDHVKTDLKIRVVESGHYPDHRAFSMTRRPHSNDLRTGTASSGAIYNVIRYTEKGGFDFSFDFLVRAAKRSRPGAMAGEGEEGRGGTLTIGNAKLSRHRKSRIPPTRAFFGR